MLCARKFSRDIATEYIIAYQEWRGPQECFPAVSILQTGTLLCRQDHGRSSCWSSQDLRWDWGWCGSWSEEDNLQPTAVECKSLWPHGKPQSACRASPRPCTRSHPWTWRGHLHPDSTEKHTAYPTLSSSWECWDVSFLNCTSCVRDTEFRPQNQGGFLLTPANRHHLGTTRAVRMGEGSQPNCKCGLVRWWKEKKHFSGKFCPENQQTSLAENECSGYWDVPHAQRAA